MLQRKIAASLVNCPLPLKKALPKAAALGVEAVELDARGELKPRDLSQTGLRQVRKWLEDHQLQVCAVRFQTRRGYDAPADLDRRIEATKEAMDFAYRLGASVVVNHLGRIPEPQEGPDWELLLESLRELANHSAKAGAFLAARTGGESGEHLAKLFEYLPAGSLGVAFDPGALLAGGHSASEAVRHLGDKTLHVHARDGLWEPGLGRGLETSLGQGAADFPELLGVLEERDYRGYFTVESSNAAGLWSELEHAVQFLKALF